MFVGVAEFVSQQKLDFIVEPVSFHKRNEREEAENHRLLKKKSLSFLWNDFLSMKCTYGNDVMICFLELKKAI